MKTKQIIAVLAAVVLLAACGKHKESDCNPYRGRYTPLTVVPGLELGMPLGEALKCPLLDTSVIVYKDFEPLRAAELVGTFVNDIPVRYSLYIDSLGALQSLHAYPVFEPGDTVGSMRIFQSIVAYNYEHYGDPMSMGGGLSDINGSQGCTWYVCGGLNERLERTESYRGDSSWWNVKVYIWR